MRLVILSSIVIASTPAWAQPPSLQPAQPLQPALQAQTVEAKPRPAKSETVAGGLSFGVTAAGLATLLFTNSIRESDDGRQLKDQYEIPLYVTSGLLLAVGPTTGHIYAGKTWNTGLAVRLVSGGIMAAAFKAALTVNEVDGHNTASEGEIGVLIAAGLVFAGATVYECGTAARSVRRYNARHAATMTIMPMLSRDPGVALVGRF